MTSVTKYLHSDLPPWVEEIRPHQQAALDEALAYYDEGYNLVVIEAPTGSGKTLIGECVRLHLHDLPSHGSARGLYVCHGKELQRQFVRDFDAPVLMGRANYPTVLSDELTADDCEGRTCRWCPTIAACPYMQARDRAEGAELAVLNTAYFLSEANGPGRMSGRELVVVDECDTLEGELSRWAEFRVGEGQAAALAMTVPRKAARWSTIMDWLREFRRKAASKAERVSDPKDKRRWARRANQVEGMFLNGDVAEWVRVYDRTGALILKPVKVDQIAGRFLWRHAERWLLMSATVVGAEQMLEDLGWEDDWAYVKVPSTFPKENRPIYPLPVAQMTRTGMEEGQWEKCGKAVRLIVDQHEGERVLVHTVSYQLARTIEPWVKETGRTVVTYTGAGEREQALALYKDVPDAVMIAPSMDRGVDLPDDLCRVMVVAKLPFPYLGDQQVSARLHTEGGDLWYTLQTIRSLVQMTGRGVRHAEDHAVTYILDRQFLANLERYKRYLPDWWTEALVTDRRPSDVIRGLNTLK